MKYLVIYDTAEDGSIGAIVPDLPGCTSSGKDYEEARANIKESISLYLEDNNDIPAPTHKAELVEIAA